MQRKRTIAHAHGVTVQDEPNSCRSTGFFDETKDEIHLESGDITNGLTNSTCSMRLRIPQDVSDPSSAEMGNSWHCHGRQSPCQRPN
jgi:hypothetical protein